MSMIDVMYDAPKTAPGTVLGAAAIVARALVVGAACGAGSGALAGIPYLIRHAGKYPLDWSKLAVAFALFSLGTGAVIGGGTASGILVADRLAARLRGAASAVLGAILGGAVVGTLPGAIGTAYFGRQPAPFVGTAVIAVLPFAGVLALSAIVADVDRRAAGARARPSDLALYALLTTIPFFLAGLAVVAYVGDEGVLRIARRASFESWMRGEDASWSFATLGASYGALLGAALGAHVGATTALARLRQRVRAQAASLPDVGS